MSNTKIIQDRVQKSCVVCGKKINVILYSDRSYRNGHYFGKIPLHSKKETAKALRAGTKTWKMNGMEFNVLKKDPKPYRVAEYWECPKCYRTA